MNERRTVHFGRKAKAAVAAVAFCTLLAGGANAKCGFSGSPNSGVAAQSVSMLARTMAHASPHAAAPSPRDAAEPSIAGLWNVSFLQQGQVVDQGFDLWASDGTEILNDTSPPPTGNICLGVWTKTAPYSYQLNHPSWIFDEANVNVIALVYIREQITLDPSGNSYTGTTTFQLRDLSGNPIPSMPDQSGDVKAERILTSTNVNVQPTIVVKTATGTPTAANSLIQTTLSPFLLDASASTGNGPLSFAWSTSSNSPVAFVATATPGQTLVQFPGAGDYVITLTVTDALGNIGTFSLTLEFTGRPQ